MKPYRCTPMDDAGPRLCVYGVGGSLPDGSDWLLSGAPHYLPKHTLSLSLQRAVLAMLLRERLRRMISPGWLSSCSPMNHRRLGYLIGRKALYTVSAPSSL